MKLERVRHDLSEATLARQKAEAELITAKQVAAMHDESQKRQSDEIRALMRQHAAGAARIAELEKQLAGLEKKLSDEHYAADNASKLQARLTRADAEIERLHSSTERKTKARQATPNDNRLVAGAVLATKLYAAFDENEVAAAKQYGADWFNGKKLKVVGQGALTTTSIIVSY